MRINALAALRTGAAFCALLAVAGLAALTVRACSRAEERTFAQVRAEGEDQAKARRDQARLDMVADVDAELAWRAEHTPARAPSAASPSCSRAIAALQSLEETFNTPPMSGQGMTLHEAHQVIWDGLAPETP